MMRKLGKNALANLTLDTSCQIDLGSTVTAVDSSNYDSKIVWGFNHDNPIQDDNTFRQQKSVVLDAIEADKSTTTSAFRFDYSKVKNGVLILQKGQNGSNFNTVSAWDLENNSYSTGITEQDKRRTVEYIYIPFGIQQLYHSVFRFTNIKSIEIPNSVTSIGMLAFANTDLIDIVLPASVNSIASQVFYRCYDLKSVDLSQTSVNNLSATFQEATVIEDVTLPDTLTTIGVNTFRSCTSLTSITIPSSVTSIGNGAFYSCSSLASIKLSDTLTTIGVNAFRSCTSLTSITIPSSVTSIAVDAFLNCNNLKQVTVCNDEGAIENLPGENGSTTGSNWGIPGNPTITYTGKN